MNRLIIYKIHWYMWVMWLHNKKGFCPILIRENCPKLLVIQIQWKCFIFSHYFLLLESCYLLSLQPLKSRLVAYWETKEKYTFTPNISYNDQASYTEILGFVTSLGSAIYTACLPRFLEIGIELFVTLSFTLNLHYKRFFAAVFSIFLL